MSGASGEHSAPLLGASPKGQRQQNAPHGRTLTLLPLAMLIFFEVSGGPFGTEDAVAAAGPLLTLLGFVVLPILWSVPEALITAELATAFPENSGYVAWVTAAFGPFWGFQEGLWSWISGVTDNSLYPVMLAANLELFFPQLASGWPRIIFTVGMSLFLSWLNYRGLTVVGHTIITSTVAVLVPFLLMSALALPHIQPKNYLRVDWDKVDWAQYLNVMFWNLNYWDSVSTLAGEVADPGRTFPRALMLGVVLVVAAYLIPTAAALGVMAEAGDWRLGYFGEVAQRVGGPWLAVWVMVAAACSQVGQYQAEMASDSYQVQGMAERGFLPKVLGVRSKHGTPVLGIVLSSAGVLLLAHKSFMEIVTLLNAIYCLAELLEFAAFVWLRYKAPNLHRPYRVPLPAWGLVIMLLPASALLLVVLALPIVTLDVRTCACTLGAIVAGFIMYPMLQLAKRRGWCEFNEIHFDCRGVYNDPRLTPVASYATMSSQHDTPGDDIIASSTNGHAAQNGINGHGNGMYNGVHNGHGMESWEHAPDGCHVDEQGHVVDVMAGQEGEDLDAGVEGGGGGDEELGRPLLANGHT